MGAGCCVGGLWLGAAGAVLATRPNQPHCYAAPSVPVPVVVPAAARCACCCPALQENEPDIFHAIKFGCILENVVFDEETRGVDYDASRITENTRASYPIEHIGEFVFGGGVGWGLLVCLVPLGGFGGGLGCMGRWAEVLGS